MFVWISIFIYGLRALDLSWWRFYIRFKLQSFVLKQEGCVIVCEHVGCQGSRISGKLVAGVSACRYCRLRTVHIVHCKSFTSHTLFSVHTIQTVHTPNCTICSLHILFSILPMHNALCIFLYSVHVVACRHAAFVHTQLAEVEAWSEITCRQLYAGHWDNLPTTVQLYYTLCTEVPDIICRAVLYTIYAEGTCHQLYRWTVHCTY